jgi:protein-disulfide isomerase
MQQHRFLIFLIFGVLSFSILTFFFLWSRPVDLESLLPDVPIAGSIAEPLVTFINPSKGSSAPLVTLVEYGDFECEPCKQLNDSLAVVLETYPNEVKVVWKHLPHDDPDAFSFPASIAAQCAHEQGLFWEYAEGLFLNQGAFSEELFAFLSEHLELDAKDFSSCYNDQGTLPAVLQDYEEGLGLGLIGTPTLFINGEQMGAGAIATTDILNYVEEILAQ